MNKENNRKNRIKSIAKDSQKEKRRVNEYNKRKREREKKKQLIDTSK